MKIMILSPKRDVFDGERYEYWEFAYMTRLVGAGKRKYSGTPLSLAILASLVPERHELIVIDENVEEIPYDTKPDLAIITFFTTSATAGYRVADKLRQQGTAVVIGGCHAAMTVEETLNHADAVSTCEGESSLVRIIKDFENGELKKVYKQEDYERPAMDSLPVPRWDLLKMDSYFNPTIQTMRGCPFFCEFCTVRVHWGHKYRFKPIENVVKEVRYLKKVIDRDVFFMIVDDDVASDRRRFKDLFRALIPEKIRWMSQGSISMAKDDEYLDLMTKSGGTRIIMGFETISKKTIEEMKKNPANNPENYMQDIKKIQSYGVALTGAFVFGFDHDDKDCFDETADFIINSHIALPQLFVLTPFPGTALAKRLEAEGRILNRDWRYYTASMVNFVPKNMTPDELQRGYYNAFQKIYSHKAVYQRLTGLWETWDKNSTLPAEAILSEKTGTLLMNKNFQAVAYSYEQCYFGDEAEEKYYKKKLKELLSGFLAKHRESGVVTLEG